MRNHRPESANRNAARYCKPSSPKQRAKKSRSNPAMVPLGRQREESMWKRRNSCRVLRPEYNFSLANYNDTLFIFALHSVRFP